jgi:hypothetical protein
MFTKLWQFEMKHALLVNTKNFQIPLICSSLSCYFKPLTTRGIFLGSPDHKPSGAPNLLHFVTKGIHGELSCLQPYNDLVHYFCARSFIF